MWQYQPEAVRLSAKRTVPQHTTIERVAIEDKQSGNPAGLNQ